MPVFYLLLQPKLGVTWNGRGRREALLFRRGAAGGDAGGEHAALAIGETMP